MLVSTKVIGYLSYARLSYSNNWCAHSCPLYQCTSDMAAVTCRAISMFTVVPLSYNRLDDTKKKRTTKELTDASVFETDEHPVFLLD